MAPRPERKWKTARGRGGPWHTQLVGLVVLIVGIGLAVWLTFSDAPRWRWARWLIPVLVAVPWVVYWMRERGEVNTQPGLLIFGGLVSVLVVCAVLLVAELICRHRRRTRTPL